VHGGRPYAELRRELAHRRRLGVAMGPFSDLLKYGEPLLSVL
jgi:hypothetical protein